MNLQLQEGREAVLTQMCYFLPLKTVQHSMAVVADGYLLMKKQLGADAHKLHP